MPNWLILWYFSFLHLWRMLDLDCPNWNTKITAVALYRAPDQTYLGSFLRHEGHRCINGTMVLSHEGTSNKQLVHAVNMTTLISVIGMTMQRLFSDVFNESSLSRVDGLTDVDVAGECWRRWPWPGWCRSEVERRDKWEQWRQPPKQTATFEREGRQKPVSLLFALLCEALHEESLIPPSSSQSILTICF